MGSVVFDFVKDNFGIGSTFQVLYVLNLVFGAIAFKLGFAKKLPILKSVFVYIMLAIGTLIMTVFSIFELPITESLIIISVVMGIYRFRLYQERKVRAQKQ